MTQKEKELETLFLDTTKTVEQGLLRVIGLCMNGKADKAGEAALTLCDAIVDARNQYQMQQEQAGIYDLKQLRVDAATSSNSETGWERDDG